MEKFNFDGHQVTSIEQGIEAVISHHVSPVVGWIRLADRDGETLDRDVLGDAFKSAATAIVKALAGVDTAHAGAVD